MADLGTLPLAIVATEIMHSLQWLKEDFIKYLDDWKEEVAELPLTNKEKQKCCLSRETQEGMKITGIYITDVKMSTCEVIHRAGAKAIATTRSEVPSE